MNFILDELWNQAPERKDIEEFKGSFLLAGVSSAPAAIPGGS